jgi:hypothetical protein
MSWRSAQLGEEFCDQDKLILSLFPEKTVNYVGNDPEFRQRLSHSADSQDLILILNTPIWVSDIIASCKQHLTKQVETFYIGINRYCVQGNDTSKVLLDTGNRGGDLIHLVTEIVESQGFSVSKSGQFDNDQGRYFNFVQPLTWVYGHNFTN